MLSFVPDSVTVHADFTGHFTVDHCSLVFMCFVTILQTLCRCCPQLGVTDTLVSRNYFGRQVDSFEADLPITHPQLLWHPGSTKEYFRGVFIRAPAVLEVTDPAVEVLASIRLSEKVEPVVVAFRQGRVLSTAFHPELTEDPRWHRYFLRMVLSEVRTE